MMKSTKGKSLVIKPPSIRLQTENEIISKILYKAVQPRAFTKLMFVVLADKLLTNFYCD